MEATQIDNLVFNICNYSKEKSASACSLLDSLVLSFPVHWLVDD